MIANLTIGRPVKYIYKYHIHGFYQTGHDENLYLVLRRIKDLKADSSGCSYEFELLNVNSLKENEEGELYVY
jgi:hypothetical protein